MANRNLSLNDKADLDKARREAFETLVIEIPKGGQTKIEDWEEKL